MAQLQCLAFCHPIVQKKEYDQPIPTESHSKMHAQTRKERGREREREREIIQSPGKEIMLKTRYIFKRGKRKRKRQPNIS